MQDLLTLVKPTEEFQYDANRFKEECLELDGVIHGGGGMDLCATYESWLLFLDNKLSPKTVTNDYVASETYFAVRQGEEKIVGVVDIRPILNERLAWRGGNISFTVRPHMRGEGIGHDLLVLALVRAKELGLEKVLLTCDEENVRAARTFFGCDAHEEENERATEECFRRFWISL